MIYRQLGRTGEKVSAVGVGTGGLDPMGLKSGRTEAEMGEYLRAASDLGINLFDTSPGYGDGRSERILGTAAKDIGRDRVLLSTKMALAGSMPGEPTQFMRPEEVGPALDGSLQRLQTDYIDVMLMAVADVPEAFGTVTDDIMPELLRLKDQGKIRFVGSSEQTRSDGAHVWLRYVLPFDHVDVAMVGHNMLNQSAARTVFPLCREEDIGALNIFTVRNLFCNLPRLKEVLADLKARGVISQDAVSDESPLSWLLEEGECASLVEAAYRYAAYTEGISAVMCGAIFQDQLEDDIAYIEKGPLPAAALQRLRDIFGHIDEPMGN